MAREVRPLQPIGQGLPGTPSRGGVRVEPSGFSEGSVLIRPEQEATLTTYGSTLAEIGHGLVAPNSSINRDPTERSVQPVRATPPAVATTAQPGLAKMAVFWLY